MHSSVASFYGGYDQVECPRPVRRQLSSVVLLIVVAAVVLLGFVAADVSAFQRIPVAVHVTEVAWYAGPELLTTASGFTMHSSQSVTLTLTCNAVCYEITHGSVNAPFQLTGFTVTYAPIQYVNATIVAPTSAYTGPVVITLS